MIDPYQLQYQHYSDTSPLYEWCLKSDDVKNGRVNLAQFSYHKHSEACKQI